MVLHSPSSASYSDGYEDYYDDGYGDSYGDSYGDGYGDSVGYRDSYSNGCSGYKFGAQGVFIDTSLNTHLAITSDSSDTVPHLKNKIMLEHALCFPKFGRIQVHAVKVRRDGKWYHLSDSMLVRCAFSGFHGAWYLNIDASAVPEIENPQIDDMQEQG